MGNNNKISLHQINNLCNCQSSLRLDDCGCCEGIKTFTPAHIENPPSLSSIRYRIGTHGMFKTSMLAHISKQKDSSCLSRLTTREDNDLAIAIIDAWATIADVITFYQERIANEGFLRTSTERMSVLELARSIGYELSPGVASDTFLVFMLENNNPHIEKSIIEKGTKIQSIPQQEEMPQIFETIEKIEARPELNEIKANTKLPYNIDKNTNLLYFQGTDINLKTDDRLLIVNTNGQQSIKFFAKVLDVKTDEKINVTRTSIQIIWPPKKRDANTGANTNTTNDNELSSSGNEVLGIKEDELTFASKFLGKEMKLPQYVSMAIQKGVSETELIDDHNREVEENVKSYAPQVYAFRQKTAIFGHNAPSYDAITLTLPSLEPHPILVQLSNWDAKNLYIYQKVNIKKHNSETDNFENYGLLLPESPMIFLDNVYENIITKNQDKDDDWGNWAVFSSPEAGILAAQVVSTIEETLVEYTITGQATGIRLKALDSTEQLQQFRRRNTTVFIQSERLELAEKIDETPVQGDFIELEKGLIGLKNGQVAIITGEILDETEKPTGKTGTEYRNLREVTTKRISFDRNLDNKYLRDSVKIYANVAKATHGETKREVLGSGDPTLSQQSFTLKQKPLTFIKAATPTGGSNTLEVRIDDILWKEVDYLYGARPKDRVFVARNEDDGKTNVIFGDGNRGARPSIGVENITAKYRIGIGKEGLLRRDQLSLLMDRPLGVKSVTNPFPTSASEDPENLESAKINAPLKVLTMDRIVSFSDFENFARSFAGIGKAKASEIWNSTKTIIHLSIASSSGEKLDPLTYENIIKSIERFKAPFIPFIVDSFIKKTFSITAKIKVNEDMLQDKVLLSVKNALLDTFSFEKRDFAQPVTLSEVVTLIQNIQGVKFVDLDQLHIDGKPEEIFAQSSVTTTMKKDKTGNKLQRYLSCSPAYYHDTLKKISPAEMLIVNPEGVTLLVVD